MKIYCLCENTARDGFLCEHGLSLYIETGKLKILFDMGQSTVFCENARRMGVDLRAVAAAFLSHGHYDHGGGIAEFLKINQKARLYLSKKAFAEHHNASEKYNGIDNALIGNERLVLCDGGVRLAENVRLYSAESIVLYRPIDSAGLKLKTENGFVPDEFPDEQYLEITENGKRTVLSGCSHRGVLNIARSLTPDVLIGGFHLMKQSAEGAHPVLDALADELLRCGSLYVTCHCTGAEQYEYLKKTMKDSLRYLRAGDILEI